MSEVFKHPAMQDCVSVVESNNQRKLTIRDMMIATAVVAVFCALAIPALRILADPGKFVSSLGNWAFEVMLICTFGTFGFPSAIVITGTLVLSKSDSPLRGFYALLVFASAIASFPLAYVIAKACAEAFGA